MQIDLDIYQLLQNLFGNLPLAVGRDLMPKVYFKEVTVALQLVQGANFNIKQGEMSCAVKWCAQRVCFSNVIALEDVLAGLEYYIFRFIRFEKGRKGRG